MVSHESTDDTYDGSVSCRLQQDCDDLLIRRSDPSSVYVSSKDSDRVAAIYRGRVKEIDHPGNVHAIIGTTLGVVGWTAAIWGIVHEVGCEGMFCERGSVNGG